MELRNLVLLTSQSLQFLVLHGAAQVILAYSLLVLVRHDFDDYNLEENTGINLHKKIVI